METRTAVPGSRPCSCQARPLTCHSLRPRRFTTAVRGTHRLSVQAVYTVYVKADPEDPNRLGDCPFSHRVLLALEEKKADYERKLVDLKNKPDWFLKLTEAGTTPVFQVNEDGQVLTDSGQILSFLDEKIAEPKLGSPDEMPESAKELFPTFVSYLKSSGPEGFKKMTEMRGVIEELNGYFKSHGPFVNGPNITAADCVLAPLLFQTEIALNELKEVDLYATMNGIAKYNDNMHKRPSWQNTQYRREAVIAGWKPKLPSA